MQNMECHSVAEQLMAAGATGEEVKKISQIMAQTVRKLEGGSTIPEPGIEELKPACDVVVLDAELHSCIPGFSSMDIEGQEAIKRSLSPGPVCATGKLFGAKYGAIKWPMGSEFAQQERSGIGTTIRTSW